MILSQNATLAGGVAIGSCCNLMVHPGGALIIGTIAGCVSTSGMHYGSPFLARVFKVHDVSSVHNLHGLPAIIACFSRWVQCLIKHMTAFVSTENFCGQLLWQLITNV